MPGRICRPLERPSLKESGEMDNTIIVLTSDHGDYLGDHWLGEKDLFHAQSVKVPLIIYDPSHQADCTRGMYAHNPGGKHPIRMNR